MSGYSSTYQNEYFAPQGVPGTRVSRKRKRTQKEIALDTAVGVSLGIGAVVGGKKLFNLAKFRKGRAIIGLRNQFRDLETLVSGRERVTKWVKGAQGGKVKKVLNRTVPLKRARRSELIASTESLIKQYLPADVIANNKNNPMKLRKMVLEIVKNPNKQYLTGYQKWLTKSSRPAQRITNSDLKVSRRLYVEAMKRLRNKETHNYLNKLQKNPQTGMLQREPRSFFTVKEIKDEIGRMSREPSTLSNPLLKRAGYDPNRAVFYQDVVEYLQSTDRGGAGINVYKSLVLPGSDKPSLHGTNEFHMKRVMGYGLGGRVAEIRDRQRNAKPPWTTKLPKYFRKIGEKWEKRSKKE